MKTYHATPYAITDRAIAADVTRIISAKSKTPLGIDNYAERVGVDAQGDTAEEACEVVWTRFQNLDHQTTPDGQRALMVGDLVRLVDEAGETSWFAVDSFGFIAIEPPAELA